MSCDEVSGINICLQRRNGAFCKRFSETGEIRLVVRYLCVRVLCVGLRDVIQRRLSSTSDSGFTLFQVVVMS